MDLADIPSVTYSRAIKLLAITFGGFLILRVLELQQYFFADAEAFTGLIHISGTLYSVLYAFATYVIWGQFIAVETEILKEAGTLKDLVLFSRRLKEVERDPMVRAIRIYTKAVIDSEWEMLSSGVDPESTERLFIGVISTVTEFKPQDDDGRLVHSQLLSIAQGASEHRNERIALSRKRIPRTLLNFVMLTGGMIFLLVFLYPYHNAALGLCSILMTSLLALLCALCTDRP